MSAMRCEPMGLVVVGYGSAGRSRVRALGGSAAFSLRGVVSRRGAAALGTGTGTPPTLLRWDDVLADASIPIVAICTESADHPLRVRAAIAAEKQVLVEYPLALSSAEGRALFAEAERAGVVLYEGHVELFADPHLELRSALAARRTSGSAALHSVELSFTGGAEEQRIAREGPPSRVALGGFPSFSGIARLNRLVDLFGPLRVVAVDHRPAAAPAAGFELTADFESASEVATPVRWREERGTGLARRTECTVRYSDGSELRGYGERRPGPVFARDSEHFARVLAGGVDAAPERRRIEHCLDLAEEIRCRALAAKGPVS